MRTVRTLTSCVDMTIVLPRGSMVKNLTARQELQFRSLGWEDPLEEEMATHSCLGNLMDREEPGRLWSMGSQRVGHDYATSLSLFFFF